MCIVRKWSNTQELPFSSSISNSMRLRVAHRFLYATLLSDLAIKCYTARMLTATTTNWIRHVYDAPPPPISKNIASTAGSVVLFSLLGGSPASFSSTTVPLSVLAVAAVAPPQMIVYPLGGDRMTTAEGFAYLRTMMETFDAELACARADLDAVIVAGQDLRAEVAALRGSLHLDL